MFCFFLSKFRPELVVKKLRYYARYIVVCLLLNKMDLVKVLVKVRMFDSFSDIIVKLLEAATTNY